jgi:protoporphyrinogen/coproporphyrinogen III oxidase
MSNNYAVTVMVVNLYYKSSDLLPIHGFGYLIPRSVPFIQNPECALGVIFASESSVGQDSARGTKLTVMLGGHWWDGWAEHDFPDEKSAINMAKAVLERHMHVTEQPVVAKARLQRNAIPQYTVGHVSRMEELHEALVQQFNSRLKVAGAWYTGIGVHDCVRSGRLAASSVLSGSGTTGLEKYTYPNRLGHHVARE